MSMYMAADLPFADITICVDVHRRLLIGTERMFEMIDVWLKNDRYFATRAWSQTT